MKLSDLIDPSRILLGIRATGKSEVMAYIAKRAGAELSVPSGMILGAMSAREKLGSTGFGHGVAIPHVRLAEVVSPFGLLLRLARPIEFDAIDAMPVDILFALLMPQADGADAVAPLAVVSRCMRDDSNLRAIRTVGSPARLFAVLQQSSD